jgi:hypothetical protein
MNRPGREEKGDWTGKVETGDKDCFYKEKMWIFRLKPLEREDLWFDS